MELTKNIFFNTDKLVEGSTVKVSYTGEFFQNNAEGVYIHYGFGLLWENVNEIAMEKTELGFQTELALTGTDSLNFCFRDSNSNWDNNGNVNYTFPIEKVCTDLVLADENNSLAKTKRLRRTYIWNKKIKLAVYKIITYLPKLISGNYKRKVNNED